MSSEITTEFLKYIEGTAYEMEYPFIHTDRFQKFSAFLEEAPELLIVIQYSMMPRSPAALPGPSYHPADEIETKIYAKLSEKRRKDVEALELKHATPSTYEWAKMTPSMWGRTSAGRELSTWMFGGADNEPNFPRYKDKTRFVLHDTFLEPGIIAVINASDYEAIAHIIGEIDDHEEDRFGCVFPLEWKASHAIWLQTHGSSEPERIM